MRDYIRSFRDLPLYAYQIQTKFRNEARAKSGIMRGREFLMKDLYSFSRDEKEHAEFYERAKKAYINVFTRVGIGERTYLTFASGGRFFKNIPHEFQTSVTEAGEDTIHVCEKCAAKGVRIAVNAEILVNRRSGPECGNADSGRRRKAVRGGEIFSVSARVSPKGGLILNYLDESGVKKACGHGQLWYRTGASDGYGRRDAFRTKRALCGPKRLRLSRYIWISLALGGRKMRGCRTKRSKKLC